MFCDQNFHCSEVKDVNVQYISVNLLDETRTWKPTQKNELGNIDYAGITKDGQKVIGLAYFDYDTSEFVLDPVLKWNLPIHMSLQNAVTVPHAFVTVGFCLNAKKKNHNSGFN